MAMAMARAMAAVMAMISTSASAAPLPHIVSVLQDDLGFYDSGIHNPAAAKWTQNISSLAREGVHRRKCTAVLPHNLPHHNA